MRSLFAHGALVLSLVAAVNSIALAAPPPAPAAPPVVKEPSESPQYRALLEEAVSEYDARRYEEARALFRRAHDISPNARTLRGIGMASFELREYVEALRSLEGALADKRRPLTAVQRQQVEVLLERTRAFVGRFFVKTTPKDALLRVDGAPVALENDGSLLLSFGRHSIVAEAPGSTPESREINVIGGERQELAFQLRPIAIAAPPSTRPAGGAGLEGGAAAPIGGGGNGAAGTAEAPGSTAIWWYSAAGVAAAGTLSAALWWSYQNQQLDRCRQNRADPPNDPTALGCHQPDLDSLTTRRSVAIGTTIGAAAITAVTAIIGTVVWATNKPEPGTAIACGAGPGAVNCELKISF